MENMEPDSTTTTAATTTSDGGDGGGDCDDPQKARETAEAVLKLAEHQEMMQREEQSEVAGGGGSESENNPILKSPIKSPIKLKPPTMNMNISGLKAPTMNMNMSGITKRFSAAKEKIQMDFTAASQARKQQHQRELMDGALDRPSMPKPKITNAERMKNLRERMNATRQQIQTELSQTSKQVTHDLNKTRQEFNKVITKTMKEIQTPTQQQKQNGGNKTKKKKSINIDEKILKDLDLVHSKCIACLSNIVHENDESVLDEIQRIEVLNQNIGFLEACLPRMDELVAFAVIDEIDYLKPTTTQNCITTYEQLIQVLQQVSSPLVDKLTGEENNEDGSGEGGIASKDSNDSSSNDGIGGDIIIDDGDKKQPAVVDILDFGEIGSDLPPSATIAIAPPLPESFTTNSGEGSSNNNDDILGTGSNSSTKSDDAIVPEVDLTSTFVIGDDDDDDDELDDL